MAAGGEVEGVAGDDDLGLECGADAFGEVRLPTGGIGAELAAFTGDPEASEDVVGAQLMSPCHWNQALVMPIKIQTDFGRGAPRAHVVDSTPPCRGGATK